MLTQSSAGRVAANRLPPAARLLSIAMVLVLAAGCNLPPADVWMYVDNSGPEPLTVSVDGREAARVAPDTFELIKCQPGQHQIAVRRGEEVLLDGVQDLKASEQFGVTRKFLLNPDGGNRYAIYTAQYGDNPFKGMLRSAIAGAAANPPNAAQMAFHDLLKDVKPLPAAMFNDLGGTHYVLTVPPESMMISGHSQQVTVLTRIKAEDHAVLTAARDNKSPTAEDVEKLSEVCDRIVYSAE